VKRAGITAVGALQEPEPFEDAIVIDPSVPEPVPRA
jgi:hypothetical protein